MSPLVLFASAALGGNDRESASGRMEWRAGIGRVYLGTPGEHVSPDAPTTLTVGDLSFALRGDPSALRFPVPDGAVDVSIELALCRDESTACRTAHLGGTGTVATRRGAILLAEGAPSGHARTSDGEGHGLVKPPDAATGNGIKVYDFTAVWCPPCNLLAAEILHDPAATGGIPIQAVDVDRPESWALKDRYRVGGYPTLVAVDAQGTEVDRMVGYPGAPIARAWFGGLAKVVPLEVLAKDALAGGLADLSGADLAAAARRLAEGEREDAAKALFPRAADTADLHVAHLIVEPTEADAHWLFEHHAPAGDWVYAALDAAPTLWMEAVAMAPAVSPVQGADLLAAAAEHAPAETRRALQLSALALLRAAQTGDPAKDRGHFTFLAELMAETGDLDGAIAFLDHAATTFPDEFTFPYAAARHLLDGNRLPEAEAHARTALEKAWGDQRLRASVLLAKVLRAEKRPTDALAVLDAALAEPRPDAALQVRTHRYVKDAEALRAEIAPNPSKAPK